jgi:decaprenylphospho-beta-D-erythro-pentofuranosid-2-ulose 2-reductase
MLVAHGTLPDQALCQRDVNLTLHELSTNFLSVVSLLTLFGNYFEENRRGCLAVISSVAGDRGRQSNYIYGSAKAAVTVFLQGLRNRLFKAGVTVITVKPGFVDTPMTARLPKNFLYADPAVVGQRIFKAIIKGQEVVYVPWFWRWIMMLVKFIPERFFKQMRL